jgi:tRNA modification GTPase
MDTIFGLASGGFGCGIAVIRVSGPGAVGVFKALSWKNHIEPRRVEMHTLTDPSNGKTLDTIICIHFPPDYSYTGEDVIELQLHGGRAAVESVLQAVSKIPGCRHALPGEFTRRSFENGGFDLLEAEGTLDLLQAETELQRLQALDVAAGNASRLYNGWRESLLSLQAMQPMGAPVLAIDLKENLTFIIKDLRDHMNDSHKGERMHKGIVIAVIGAEAAGKSSLLRALVRRDDASVLARTERGEITEIHMDLDGYPVIMTDALSQPEKADLKLALFDGTKPTQDPNTLKMIDSKTLSIFTKADIGKPGGAVKSISVTTGEGMDAFMEKLTERVATLFRSRPGSVITRRRHRVALEQAVAALDRALAGGEGIDAGRELETAQMAIGTITGAIRSEEIVDLVFREFPSGA